MFKNLTALNPKRYGKFRESFVTKYVPKYGVVWEMILEKC